MRYKTMNVMAYMRKNVAKELHTAFKEAMKAWDGSSKVLDYFYDVDVLKSVVKEL